MLTLAAMLGATITTVALLVHDEEEVQHNWALVLGPRLGAFLSRLRFEVASVDLVLDGAVATAVQRRSSDPEVALDLLALASQTIEAATPLRVRSIANLIRVVKSLAATLPLALPRGFGLRPVAALAALVRLACTFAALPEQRALRLRFLSAAFQLALLVFRRGIAAVRRNRDGWRWATASAADWTRLDRAFLETVETVLADAAFQRAPERARLPTTVH